MPETVGEYRVVGKLGEGGMGVVYEAEQQHPRRRVAVKVLRGGQFVDELRIKMFRREIDTLARLKHPNIGAIYESGCTDDGQHFFAMELVAGATLDEYLAGRSTLDPGELELRLRLFRKIADAVHYAHQRGVIHRDLKPSNIVVPTVADDRSVGEAAEAKILDFGLARIEDPQSGESQVTQYGTIRGTLSYMSPEQTLGTLDDVDVRADVYALGVILYEMLTDRLPLEVEQIPLLEAVRVIQEDAPVPLGRSWDAAMKLDPDLETIVHKALEKEPDRRYASAAALSEDVERFLTSQPILAHPPSTTYQIRKLISRHKLTFGFAGILALLVLGFGIGMSVLYARALAAESRAVAESETAESALEFMIDMFVMSDPGEARGRSVTAREILDRGAAGIESEFENRPEVQARLMATMGWVYRGLGLYEEAQPLLERSLLLRQEILGPNHLHTLRSMNNLAILYENIGRTEDAERLHLDALRIQRERLGPENVETLRSISNLAVLYLNQRRLEEAEALYAEAIDTQRRVLGDDDPATLRSINNLAVIYKEQGRYAEAEPLQRAVLEGRERKLGPDHPETLGAMNNLAVLLDDQGRYEEAEPLYLQTLDAQRRVLGRDHPETLTCQYNLGMVYLRQGRLEMAGPVFLDALERLQRARGENHPDTLDTLYNLACVSALTGRRDEAVDYLRRAVDRGYTYGGNPAGMLSDTDLASLHGDPGFEAVAVKIRAMARR